MIQILADSGMYLPKVAENLYPHKNLHMDVYRSLIHNCQNLGVAKIPSQTINYDTSR